MKCQFTQGVFTFLFIGGVAAADDGSWPQFRGPNGGGMSISQATGPFEFGPGKNEVWKAPLPSGLSSPCVWADRIFITACHAVPNVLQTTCLDRNDGRIVWQEEFRVESFEPVDKTNSPAAATAACDGERVYVYFGSYGVIAYSISGKRDWV